MWCKLIPAVNPPSFTFTTKPQRMLFALLITALIPSISRAKDDLPPTFADAEPILAKNCVSCHNYGEQKGDLVLDRGPLQLEHPNELIKLISGPEPEMPEKGAALKASEIEILKKWIDAGAPFPKGWIIADSHSADRDWWSLYPLVKTQAPDIAAEDETWCRNDIDRFIIAKLREEKLSPSPEADARTLGRRLYYDLTGLPPTPKQMQKFLQASASHPGTAFENLVDELLDSPRYGEHWARHWLDVVRYGDTHGYDKDKLRLNAWPYRDYVIRSFNDDKPYARFVEEQIAGDVLWPGNPDGIIATGFIAAGPWDFIAHAEVGEGKVDGRIGKNMDRDDMVTATFNTFMSITVQCARCHDHKFDPVSMEDYYRSQAVFAAVDRADRVYDLDPSIQKQKRTLSDKLTSLKAEQKTLEEQITKLANPELKKIEARIKKLKETSQNTLKAPEYGFHSLISKTPNTEKWVQLDLGSPVAFKHLELIACHDEYAGIGAGFGFPKRFRIEASNDLTFKNGIKIIADKSQSDYPFPGVLPQSFAGNSNEKFRFIRITATQLAERKNDYIFALAELRVLDSKGNNVALGKTVTSLDSIQAPVRWRRSNLVDNKFPHPENEAAMQELTQLENQRSSILKKVVTAEMQKKRSQLNEAIKECEKQLNALPAGKLVYAAASDFKARGRFKPTKGTARPIYFLTRGDIRSVGPEMSPGAPPLWTDTLAEFNLPPNHVEGERRANLARYLTDKKNPLTWRSIVNRVWLYHFGRGISDTPGDFGRMGAAPSHPELLNWLAAEFRDKQSLKTLHRKIVTSSAWRQSSAYDPAKAAIDSSNMFYWRSSRTKLTAEELRDSVLAVSGRLNLEMGGPGFQDFVLEKNQHSPHYEYQKYDPENAASHRRSIYRFIPRSRTQPFLTTLDCADPSQSVAKRDETTTALQALTLLNNPFMETMAKHFAKRVEKSKDPLTAAFQLAANRNPKPKEKATLQPYLDQYGLENTCRLILNLNEFTYVD